MGMEFPKRDTDGPRVTWKTPKQLTAAEIIAIAREFYGLPSAADPDKDTAQPQPKAE